MKDIRICSLVALTLIFFLANRSGGAEVKVASQGAGNPRDKAGSSSATDNFIQKMENGYSFKYHKCWEVGGEEEDVSQSDNVDIKPSATCPKSEKGNWVIGIYYNDPAISIDEFWLVQKRSPNLPMNFDGKIEVSGKSAIIYEQVTPETDPLVDRKDQSNLGWLVILTCGKKNLTISYGDHLNKAGRDKARKDHSPPTIFKNFIAGFKCEDK